MIRAGDCAALLVLFSVAGCGALSTRPAWQTSYDSAAGECERTYNGTRQYVAVAKCMAKAEEILRSAPGVYQDLITLRQTTRIALATKVENKQIAPEDAAAQMALTISYVASEAQRRDTGQQTANAQQDAALAATANRPQPLAMPAPPPAKPTILCNGSVAGNTISTTCN
jgi:hypothetical protein